jgi:putative ABC transport system ATP-binding protein
LTARGLVKEYGNTSALRLVDLDVTQGQVLAIVGPSGSGKSTLLLCLAGIIEPDEGTVAFQGQPLRDLSARGLSRLRRTAFGVLFQFGQLIPELSVVENVALPLLIDGTRRRESVRLAAEQLDRLGVEHLRDSLPGQVSGGEAQRVALARALVTQPDVLFADEPTGALDSASGRLVLDEIDKVANDCGTAVVMVTHDENVAGRADRVVELRDGAVVAAVFSRESR